MPIYEYRCSACGHELESLQKFSDAPLCVCPACDAASLVKLVSACAFKLKGNGWYATDFKGGSKATAEKSGADSKPAAPAASDTKGDAAPAAACGSGGCDACS